MASRASSAAGDLVRYSDATQLEPWVPWVVEGWSGLLALLAFLMMTMVFVCGARVGAWWVRLTLARGASADADGPAAPAAGSRSVLTQSQCRYNRDGAGRFQPLPAYAHGAFLV